MTMPILATDRHVRLTQMWAHMARGKWAASGIRHVASVPPTAPVVVNNANDFVSYESTANPPGAGERKPHPKRAIFSLAYADVDHGDGLAGNAHFPPSYPMPGGEVIIVPDVVNTAQAAAEAALLAIGFFIGDVTSATDPVIVVGNVISQDPVAAATAKAGTAVDLVISLGP
jgi:hypothetical protein